MRSRPCSPRIGTLVADLFQRARELEVFGSVSVPAFAGLLHAGDQRGIESPRGQVGLLLELRGRHQPLGQRNLQVGHAPIEGSLQLAYEPLAAFPAGASERPLELALDFLRGR